MLINDEQSQPSHRDASRRDRIQWPFRRASHLSPWRLLAGTRGERRKIAPGTILDRLEKTGQLKFEQTAFLVTKFKTGLTGRDKQALSNDQINRVKLAATWYEQGVNQHPYDLRLKEQALCAEKAIINVPPNCWN